MQFSMITLFGLFGASIAIPAMRRQTNVCSSGNPNCCDVDILGIADLNCDAPPIVPATVDDFTTICADIGKIAMCCTLDLLSQGLLCSNPI